MEGDPDDVHRRAFLCRHLLEPRDTRVRVVKGEQREQAWERDAVADLVTVVPAEQVHRRALLGFVQSLERC